VSWKKFFTPVPTQSNANGSYSPFSMKGQAGPGPAAANYSSHLPDVYVGSPNRIERYNQYNTMDSDSEVNAALDILAEFCSQKAKDNDTHFNINFKKQANNSEVKILGEYLKQWCKIQQFDTRMFRIIRNSFKYGDQFFIRDPETQKWFHLDPSQVTKIIVNESEGKKPEQYVVKNLNFAFGPLEATPLNTQNSYGPGGTAGYQTISQKAATGSATPPSGSSRWQSDQSETFVDANHVIHLSMSEGLDQNFPFGNSLLESIFKVYKQKELLEDAIIIYRVQRAPERRVFYVDVGNMPSHLAMQFVERVKTEIHQRRIPSKTGGGTNVIDSSYNPLSINEDYFFPQTAEGRGSKVETLPGGTNLGEIDDLRYFTNKLVRGLRIPSSYLPTGADDGASQYNDGRVGTAYIQELRFNKYCERLQGMLEEVFNTEFKLYLKNKGVNVDYSMFDLDLTPPQNFAAYRQAELDNNRISTFSTIQAVPFMSNRFALKRFLGLSDEEIAENERLWMEENQDNLDAAAQQPEMGAAGLSGAGLADDFGGLETELGDAGDAVDAGDGEAPETATGDDIGGAAEAEPTDQTV
jgi:hypothetical protein|tara:strand:- start:5891 stop:7633 length:1743 start_codon:yes stop_codon:yes gene_type:complete